MNNFIKRHGSTILTAVGVVGVVVTGYLVHEDTKKALKKIKGKKLSKKEKLKETWSCYIPSAISTTATVAAIVAGKRMDTKKIAALIGTAGASGKLLYEYKDAIKERYGRAGLNDITRDVAKRHEDGVPVAKVSDIRTYWMGGPSESEDNLDPAEKCNELFYDEFAGVWFYSTKNNVRAAMYYLNHNHVQQLYSTYQDFYDFLGIDLPEDLKSYEWGDEYLESTEACWIEMELVDSCKDDGTEYSIIRFGYNPDAA